MANSFRSSTVLTLYRKTKKLKANSKLGAWEGTAAVLAVDPSGKVARKVESTTNSCGKSL